MTMLVAYTLSRNRTGYMRSLQTLGNNYVIFLKKEDELKRKFFSRFTNNPSPIQNARHTPRLELVHGLIPLSRLSHPLCLRKWTRFWVTRHSGRRPECIQLWPNFDRTLFSVGHIRAYKSSCLYQTGIVDNEKQNDFANPVTTESRITLLGRWQ